MSRKEQEGEGVMRSEQEGEGGNRREWEGEGGRRREKEGAGGSRKYMGMLRSRTVFNKFSYALACKVSNSIEQTNTNI